MPAQLFEVSHVHKPVYTTTYITYTTTYTSIYITYTIAYATTYITYTITYVLLCNS